MSAIIGSPARQDIEIPRGDDRIIRVTMEDNGSIAGWHLELVVRHHRNEADEITPVLSKSSADGAWIEVEGDAETPAVIAIPVTNEESASLDRRRYWWACRRTNEGFATTLVHGIWDATNTATT